MSLLAILLILFFGVPILFSVVEDLVWTIHDIKKEKDDE